MIDTIITVASWEPRFLQGMKKNMEKNPSVKTIVIFYFNDYFKWSRESILTLEKISNTKGINCSKELLSFANPAKNWNTLKERISDFSNDSSILIDFTTMPRSIIWYLLFFLHHREFKLNYIYHKAGSYNSEWLSRNPDRPRLLYKLSGITHLGRPTLLMIFTGYDPERVEHLISHFEPSLVKLVIQNSDEFENKKYLEKYQVMYKGHDNLQIDGFNSFEIDATIKKIDESISDYESSHNIIITSLGPKTSALSLFRYVLKHPDIGLCYVPAKEFNKEYSKGMGESIEGVLDV